MAPAPSDIPIEVVCVRIREHPHLERERILVLCFGQQTRERHRDNPRTPELVSLTLLSKAKHTCGVLSGPVVS